MASCGAKAPCCHIGYPHRHCEHCDTVIATYSGYWNPPYPRYAYTPWYSQLGATTMQSATNNTLVAQLQSLNTNAAQSHLCEVN